MKVIVIKLAIAMVLGLCSPICLLMGQKQGADLGEKPALNFYTKSSLLSGNSLVTTSNLPVTIAASDGECRDAYYSKRVLFELNQDLLTTRGRFMATLNFSYGNSMADGELGVGTMTLVYDKGDVKPEQSRQAFVVDMDASDMRFEIWNINIVITDLATGQIMNLADYSAFLSLQLEIGTARRCQFDCGSCVMGLNVSTTPSSGAASGNNIIASWNAVDGAINYDLEWIFIDNYGKKTIGGVQPATPPSQIIPNFHKNAARVTIKETEYRIPNVFESGYLVFRVRARGLGETSYENSSKNSTVEGPWSNECADKGAPLFTLSDFFVVKQVLSGTTVYLTQAMALNAHEGDKLNWQLVSTFAEDGKRKDVVSYYDGAMYNRQTVTLNSSDKHAIVAEQYYDHLGRASLTALPGPVNDARLRFYNSFNQNAQGAPFGKQDFDLNAVLAANGCYPEAAKMSSNSGTSKYYSPNNDFAQFSHRKLIPDGQGYPYIRTMFTPDATGRVAVVGNVGADFQVGRGHDTKYEYATPSQRELDELFGNNVGHAEHYKRETVQDPNGQRSLTYKDAHGRTIATALAGIRPDNLGELESNAPSQREVTESLISPTSQAVQDYCITTNKVITVDKAGVNHFTYSLTAPENNIECFASDICFNCIYDLRIQIYRNDACKELLHDSNPLLVGKPLMPNPDPNCDPVGQKDGGVGTATNGVPCEILNTACEGELEFELAGGINLTLEPGSYLVVKKLCVNQKAADDYTEFYLSSQEANCVSTYNQFLASTTAEMMANNCSDVCDPVNPHNPAVADFLGEFEPCDVTPNLCETVKKQMLQDMTPPFGQYAQMRVDPSVTAPNPQTYIVDDYLSVFHATPVLATSECVTSPFSFGAPYNYTSAVFRTTKDPNSPAYQVQTLQGMKDINDPSIPLGTILDHWQRHWAEAMLPLHPEYCALRFCELAEPSYEFDAKLVNMQFNDAKIVQFEAGAPTLLDNGHNPHFFEQDPLFAGIYDFMLPQNAPITAGSGALINSLIPWTPNGVSKVQWLRANAYHHFNKLNDKNGEPPVDLLLATLMATHCMAMSPSQLQALNIPSGTSLQSALTQMGQAVTPPAGCTPPPLIGNYPDQTISDEKRWYMYKANYLSAKNKIMEHLLKRWMDSKGCANHCIPVPVQSATQSSPLQVSPPVLATPPTFTGQNRAPAAPCKPETESLYRTKTKRFIFGSDMEASMSPKPNLSPRNYGDPTDQTNYPLGNSGYSMDDLRLLGGIAENTPIPWCIPTVPSPCAPSGGGGKSPGATTSCNEGVDIGQLVLAILNSGSHNTANRTLSTAGLSTNGLLLTLNGGNILPPTLTIVELTGPGNTGNRVFELRGMVTNLMVTIPPSVPIGPTTAFNVTSTTTQRLPTNFLADVVLEKLPVPGPRYLVSLAATSPIRPWCAPACPQDVLTITDPSISATPTNVTVTHCNICGPITTTEVTATPEPCSLRVQRLAEATALYEYNRYMQDLRQRTRRQYLDKCVQATERMGRVFNDSRHHFTLYYYDQSGMLVATVPPAGVKQLDATEIQQADDYRNARNGAVPIYPTHTKHTQYWFNGMGGAYKQQTPDGGESKFYFDYLGRIIASQDADQADVSSNNLNTYYDSYGKERISYTLYDGLGRSVEAGQAALNQPLAQLFTNGGFESYANFETNISSTAVFKIEKTTTLYDAEEPLNYMIQRNLRGRVSASYYQAWGAAQTGPSNLVVYSYDVHGNVEKVHNHAHEPLEFASEVEYDYDLLSGKVNEVVYNRSRVDQLVHRYEYDADNRLKKVQTSRDGVLWDEDARYIYYPHGPLARTELGEHRVQGNDYTYTLQGWIKGVNTASLNAMYDPSQDSYTSQGQMVPELGRNWQVARDAVGYNLHYRQNDYQGIVANAVQPGNGFVQWGGDLWNGNIRAMTTAIRPFMNDDAWHVDVPNGHRGPAGTQYQYDQLNRIASSVYHQGFDKGGNVWIEESVVDDAPASRYYNSYTYDADGNILNLKRNGTIDAYINGQQVSQFGQAGQPGQLEMDDLYYSYATGNNRLQEVKEYQTVDAAYSDATGQTYDVADFDGTHSYQYHANGALSTDFGETDGTVVCWNMLQKPRMTWSFKDGSLKATRYSYTPSGQRLAKMTFNENDEVVSLMIYQRDATGNVLATYDYPMTPEAMDLFTAQGILPLQSHTIYGSSRLAEWRPERAPKTNGGDMDPQFPNGDEPAESEKLKTKETLDARLKTLDSLNKKPRANSEKFDFARIKERSAKIEAMLARTAEASMASPYVPVLTCGYEITQKNIPPDTTQSEKSANFVKQNDEVRIYTRVIVWKRYELSNHLGNVLSTITDRKVIRGGDYGGPKKMEKGGGSTSAAVIEPGFGSTDLELALTGVFFEPDVATADDYYPFGMAMPGRTWKAREADGYRYGHNTQEKSPELGEGHYTAQFWEYNALIARRWELDPKPFVFISHYAVFGNNPIKFSDVLGDVIEDGNGKEVKITRDKDKKLVYEFDKDYSENDRKEMEADFLGKAQKTLEGLNESDTGFALINEMSESATRISIDETEKGNTEPANAIFDAHPGVKYKTGDAKGTYKFVLIKPFIDKYEKKGNEYKSEMPFAKWILATITVEFGHISTAMQIDIQDRAGRSNSRYLEKLSSPEFLAVYTPLFNLATAAQISYDKEKYNETQPSSFRMLDNYKISYSESNLKARKIIEPNFEAQTGK